jgi:hypothetical protein
LFKRSILGSLLLVVPFSRELSASFREIFGTFKWPRGAQRSNTWTWHGDEACCEPGPFTTLPFITIPFLVVFKTPRRNV